MIRLMSLPPLNGYVFNILIRSIEAVCKSPFAFQTTKKDNNKHVMREFNLESDWGGVAVRTVYPHQADEQFHSVNDLHLMTIQLTATIVMKSRIRV